MPFLSAPHFVRDQLRLSYAQSVGHKLEPLEEGWKQVPASSFNDGPVYATPEQGVSNPTVSAILSTQLLIQLQ
jgi:hypothetical protein